MFFIDVVKDLQLLILSEKFTVALHALENNHTLQIVQNNKTKILNFYDFIQKLVK